MYKIEAVVKFNSGEAIVLSEKPNITYERYGNFLFGLDKYGIFANSYFYDESSPSWKAFAGRKFDIPLTDGSIIKAYGQWWDGGKDKFTETLGAKIISVTAKDIDGLKRCYVFCGYMAVEEEYLKLRSTYTRKVFEYWEYACELTGRCFRWDRDQRNPTTPPASLVR